MKIAHLIFVFILFLSNFKIFSQKNLKENITIRKIEYKDIKKIRLTESRSSNFNNIYGKTYEIISINNSLRLYDLNFIRYSDLIKEIDNVDIEQLLENIETLSLYRDTINYFFQKYKKTHPPQFIATIDSAKIKHLIDEIYNFNNWSSNSILNQLGYDSIFFVNEAERLWKSYKKKNHKMAKKLNKEESISKIKNISYAKAKVNQLIGKTFLGFTSECEISFITEQDTINFITNSTSPYMLPWKYNNQISCCNHNISIIISSLLPDYHASNKNLLLGFDKVNRNTFLEALIEKIVEAK